MQFVTVTTDISVVQTRSEEPSLLRKYENATDRDTAMIIPREQV